MALGPKDRYNSALDLAADIEHWLADEPVSVYPEPLRDRLARWGRRHKELVTSTAAIVAVVFVSLTIVVILLAKAKEAETRLRIAAENQEREANQAKEEAEEQRQIAQQAQLLAQQRAKEATEFSQFLGNLFLAADPIRFQASGSRRVHYKGPDTTARELLRLGVEKVQDELKGVPLARASVLDSLGNVYSMLALPDEAEKLVLEAYQLRRQEHAGVLDLAASQQSLGAVRLYQGRFDDAEKLFRQTPVRSA